MKPRKKRRVEACRSARTKDSYALWLRMWPGINNQHLLRTSHIFIVPPDIFHHHHDRLRNDSNNRMFVHLLFHPSTVGLPRSLAWFVISFFLTFIALTTSWLIVCTCNTMSPQSLQEHIKTNQTWIVTIPVLVLGVQLKSILIKPFRLVFPPSGCTYLTLPLSLPVEINSATSDRQNAFVNA